MNEMRLSVCYYLMYIRNPSTWHWIHHTYAVYIEKERETISSKYRTKANEKKRNDNNNKNFKQQKTLVVYIPKRRAKRTVFMHDIAERANERVNVKRQARSNDGERGPENMYI